MIDDLLDDDFDNKKYKNEEEVVDPKNAWIPHLSVKSVDMEEVVLLLDEQEILYETEPGSMFDATGIIPLTGNQLDNIKTTILIQKEDIAQVDEIMKAYLEKKALEAAVALVEEEREKRLLYLAFAIIAVGAIIFFVWQSLV